MNNLGPKSIHQIFAENLRTQCSRFESIAALCRACKINRQQFNRYLSGQNLPNPRTLKRLCEVLQLPETALFAVAGQPARPAVDPAPLWMTGTSLHPGEQHGLIATLMRNVSNRSNCSLKSGFYHCYAPLSGYPRYVMRMLISVKNTGPAATFCRRTAYSRPQNQDRQTFIGRHRGSILSDVNCCLFLGMNRIYPFEFSILKVAHYQGDGSSGLPGLALLRVPDNDMACNIALDWVGATLSEGKSAMRQIGIIAISDPSVRPEIISTLTRTGQDRKQPVLLMIQDTISNFIQEAAKISLPQ